ncbi:AAA family ATPase [Rhodococcus gordoniae]|uniref:AAA family ATPase n=1 Tax=Rhodococcus gordoniae TaxID=223392 RepID=UPI0020CD6544|nr:AAA family ATPase [Rhodococcus gordoniae]UTT51164.1 AAA family ATPase [Rhodococcus gordoniae]
MGDEQGMTSTASGASDRQAECRRIVWINGAFGAGKTTAARLLAHAIPGAVIVDPEAVGALLRPVLQPVAAVRDFQMWSAWRTLVAATLNAVVHELPDDGPQLVIVPQTITDESYWTQIRAALDPRVDVTGVALYVDSVEHRRRVTEDAEEQDALRWRLGHFDHFNTAEWIRTAFTSIDTSTLTPEAVAAAVVHVLRPSPHRRPSRHSVHIARFS